MDHAVPLFEVVVFAVAWGVGEGDVELECIFLEGSLDFLEGGGAGPYELGRIELLLEDGIDESGFAKPAGSDDDNVEVHLRG